MRYLLPLLLVVAACSKESAPGPNGGLDVISRDDLKSELRLATSYAVEANVMLGVGRQRATTFTFDSVHLVYWTDKVKTESESLRKKRPAPSTDSQYAICVSAFQSLHGLGLALTRSPGDSAVQDSVLRTTSALVPRLVAADSTL